MASKGKSVSTDPLSWADIQHRIELTRRLVSLAASQHGQAKLNLDLAAVGLAELETELATRGIAAPTTGGAQ